MRSQLFGIEPTDPRHARDRRLDARARRPARRLHSGPPRRQRPAGAGVALRIAGFEPADPKCVMRFWLALAVVALPVLAVAQTADPDPGIPLDVADARAAQISNLRYDLHAEHPRAGVGTDRGHQSSRVRSGQRRRAARHRLRDEPRARQERHRQRAVRSTSCGPTATSLVPATALKTGANQIEIGVSRRRRLAQSQS